MRPLIRNSLILAVLVLAQLGLCSALAEHICPPTRFEQKLRAMERCPDADTELAIAGASRAYEGINPFPLPWRAYNFGDVGQSPNFTCQVLERQIDRFPKMKKVVLVMDEWSFGGYDNLPAVDYLKHGYTLQHPDRGIGQEESFFPVQWQAQVPILRYRRQFLGMALAFVLGRSGRHLTPVEETSQPTDPGRECILARSGFLWVPTRPADLSDKAGKARAEHRRNAYNRDLRAENFALYRGFLERAVQRGVRVAIVLPPLHASYRKYADKQMMDEFRADLARLREGLPVSQVAVLDYFDKDFTDAEYQDTDHLNGQGATHLGQILADDLVVVWGKP